MIAEKRKLFFSFLVTPAMVTVNLAAHEFEVCYSLVSKILMLMSCCTFIATCGHSEILSCFFLTSLPVNGLRQANQSTRP